MSKTRESDFNFFVKTKFYLIKGYFHQFRLDTIEEDSKEILKKIEINNQILPFSHITNGQSSDKTAKQYYSELGKVSN